MSRGILTPYRGKRSSKPGFRLSGNGSGEGMGKQDVKRWSQRVTETSNALDLEEGVFSWDDARGIALSLKGSADHSDRRKSSAFRSAMSMLNFYVNRAGRNLPREQRDILEKAKDELRELYGRPRRRPG
jgi:hypothetical protein